MQVENPKIDESLNDTIKLRKKCKGRHLTVLAQALLLKDVTRAGSQF
jgi:hypothetical protein